MVRLILPVGSTKDFRGIYAKEMGIGLCFTDLVEIQKWSLAARLYDTRVSGKIAAHTYMES